MKMNGSKRRFGIQSKTAGVTKTADVTKTAEVTHTAEVAHVTGRTHLRGHLCWRGRRWLAAFLLSALCFAAAGCAKADESASLWEEIPGEPEGGYVDQGLWEYHDQAGNFFGSYGAKYALANDYDKNLFSKRMDGNGNSKATYEDDKYIGVNGIDVSSHSGEIDWKAVAADEEAEIEFAFIQLGYRGYTQGSINIDSCFERNLDGARENGLDAGVYFFSQAISTQEAREEADFVISTLKNYASIRGENASDVLTLPIVYDLENVNSADARTNGLSGKQITDNIIAFCDAIREAGYDTAFYCNTYWEAYVLEMSRLNNYDIWYADFWSFPQTPYHFRWWQYTYQGIVDGMPSGVIVDKNLWLKEKQQSEPGS